MNFAQSLVGFIKLLKYQCLDFKRMPGSPGLILPVYLAHRGSVFAHQGCLCAHQERSFMRALSSWVIVVPDHPRGKWSKAVRGSQKT